jgi:putative exporter of polyketide antibiotics
MIIKIQNVIIEMNIINLQRKGEEERVTEYIESMSPQGYSDKKKNWREGICMPILCN